MYKVLTLIMIVLFSCSKPEIPKDSPKQSVEKPKEIIEQKPEKVFDKSEKIKRPEFTQGIYLSAWTVATKKFITILDSAEVAGINTVVFDVKNMNGDIFFKFTGEKEFTGENIKPILNIEKVIDEIHKRNMRAVARVVMFHDQYLAEYHTELRPFKSDGSVWKENSRGKASWLDSSNENVHKYLFSVIKSVLQFNIDEIQMDYIRFPTQGKLSDANFLFQKQDNAFSRKDSTYIKREKSDIIEQVVKKVREICDEYEVDLSGDIFAIVAWQRKVDVRNTGQDITKLTKYLSAIHPMIYTSHFNKDFGYRNDVWNEPYHLVYKATKQTVEYSKDTCKVIPYIQANSWKVNYKPEYIYAQIQSIKDCNADGYILWNASNIYMKTLRWIKDSE
ncbi:MAG: putative glycoside hydrolase [Candidatus Cloacimonetes bacterium]|nr:putative glycoside hydrolase [Candidatus Cloacimonadota bacterium]